MSDDEHGYAYKSAAGGAVKADGLFVSPSGFTCFERDAGGGATAIRNGVEYVATGYIIREDRTMLRIWVPKLSEGHHNPKLRDPA